MIYTVYIISSTYRYSILYCTLHTILYCYSTHTYHAPKKAVMTEPNNPKVAPAGRAATDSSTPAAHGRRKNPAAYAGHWANYCSPKVGKIKKSENNIL